MDLEAENKPIFALMVAKDENSAVVTSHSSNLVRATIGSRSFVSFNVISIILALVLAGTVRMMPTFSGPTLGKISVSFSVALLTGIAISTIMTSLLLISLKSEADVSTPMV